MAAERPRPHREFDLIRRHFAAETLARADVRVGIGDDAAVLAPPPGCPVHTVQWTASPAPGSPATPSDGARLAASAVDGALRALARTGAEPAWITLALTLPRIDEDWLEAFATTLRERIADAGVALVGGDTTRGPLAVTLTLHGLARSSHRGA